MKKNLLLFCILIFILSGCVTIVSTEGNLKLSSGENWTLTLDFEIPSSDVQIYGDTIAQSLDEIVRQGNKNEIQVGWEQNDINNQGNIIYSLSMKGDNYQQLSNQFAGEILIKKIKENNEDLLKIHIGSLGNASINSTFTLTGGKIIETNGEKISSNSVRWLNSTNMEAIMEPPRSSGIAGFIALVGAAFVLFAIVKQAGWLNSKTTPSYHYEGYQENRTYTQSTYSDPSVTSIKTDNYRPETTQYEQPYLQNKIDETHSEVEKGELIQQTPVIERKFCPHCGKPWTPNAQFCSYCGKRG